LSVAEGGAERGASTPARVAAILAVAIALVLAGVLVLGGSDEGHEYRLVFETGGQLVPGNEVLVAGQKFGMVDEIDLTEDGQAAVKVTVQEPLTEGTTAVIRTTSLSGVANRYVSLTLGPDNAPVHADEATISGTDTTAPVDLDQLFDVFRPKERRSLQKFIQGNATIYANRGRQANRAYKFLNPALSTSERMFAELSSDSLALERFIAEGATTFGAIADRRDDLAALVTDANTALAAINAEGDALDRSLVALPGTLRQANTTFVNLRSALDDLDPLVDASYPATENLAPFLRRFKQLARRSDPVFSDLADVVNLKGPSNDLADTLEDLPKVRNAGRTAFPASIAAMNASQPNLAFIRPYSPDLFGLAAKLGEATAYYDANGHYARALPAGTNIFEYRSPPQAMEPIFDQPERQYDFFKATPNALATFNRCPGAATQPNAGWPIPEDHPWLDDGRLGGDDCDPSDVPPGLPAAP
jgi:phospholipid/cholesterol/gamma-HCH transport system substrate-binding protein